MSLWCWLGNNSTQLQAVAGFLGVIVALMVAVAAFRQAKAASEQAKAAVSQVQAAEDQAAAAREQVAAAKQQTETMLLVADIQTSPHISITAAVGKDGAILRNTIAILNNGNGAAGKVNLAYRDGSPGCEVPFPDTLVVRDSCSVPIDETRAALSGLRLVYQTIFGTSWTLEFQWNGNISRPVNERLFKTTEK